MPFFLKKFHMGFQSVSSSLRFSQSAASESASTRLYCRCSYSYHLLPKALVTLVTIVTDKTGFRLLFRPCHYTLSYIIHGLTQPGLYKPIYTLARSYLLEPVYEIHPLDEWVLLYDLDGEVGLMSVLSDELFFLTESSITFSWHCMHKTTLRRNASVYFESFVAAKQESINVSSNELSFREIERLQ